jgi:hypothetical protein
MSRWLALAETAKENTDTLPDNPTIPDKTPRKQPQVAFCRVMSGCRVEVKEKVGDTEFSLRNENPDTAADNEFSLRRETPTPKLLKNAPPSLNLTAAYPMLTPNS